MTGIEPIQSIKREGPPLRFTEAEMCELAETRAKQKLGHHITVRVTRLNAVTGTGEDRTWHFETEIL